MIQYIEGNFIVLLALPTCTVKPRPCLSVFSFFNSNNKLKCLNLQQKIQTFISFNRLEEKQFLDLNPQDKHPLILELRNSQFA